jgi:hypothetical protein
MNIQSQYRASLKLPQAEELLDLVIYRPVAFLLAKLLVHTPITPNQITAAALATGMITGICFATGQRGYMVTGAILYAIANTLDCCDGMVARMKGNGTQLGRMVDVFADVICGSFVYIGLGIGLTRAETVLPLSAWVLVIAGGISYAIQSALFDRHRNAFVARVRNSFAEQEEELTELEQQVAGSRKSHQNIWRRSLIRIYTHYMRSQQRGSATFTDAPRLWLHPRQDALIIRLWSLIGSTTHVTIFVTAILLDMPMILFMYSIVVANLWCISVALYSRALRASMLSNSANETLVTCHVRTGRIRRRRASIRH